jgi:glyoxylase-like metal-dependent hydrolase (beta-lactamase superfamily II)
VGETLIAGDTLFVFGCGRCDLKGGDPEAMYSTLKRLSSELSATTLLYPGHDYSVKPTSTLGEQLTGNPFLHFDDVHRFVRYRQQVHDRIRQEPYAPVSREEVQALGL